MTIFKPLSLMISTVCDADVANLIPVKKNALIPVLGLTSLIVDKGILRVKGLPPSTILSLSLYIWNRRGKISLNSTISKSNTLQYNWKLI